MAKAGGGGGRGGAAPSGGKAAILTDKMSKQERANVIRNLTVRQYFQLLRTGLPSPRNPKLVSYERGLFRTRAGELRRQAEKDANIHKIWNEEAKRLGGEQGRRMKI